MTFLKNPQWANRNKSRTFQSPWEFLPDLYYRPDYPCASECFTNETFRLVESRVQSPRIDSCQKCNVSRITGIGAYSEYWKRYITNRTKVIILSFGAWFNRAKGVDEPEMEYIATVKLLAKVLASYIHNGVIVVWIGLPIIPPPPRDPVYVSIFHDYGWDLYESYNKAAQNILKPIGVIYVDNLSSLLQQRVIRDSKVALLNHWCNPGITAVPSFINQVIFHFVAMHVSKNRTAHP